MTFLLLLADVPSPGRYHHSSGPSVWLVVAVPVAVVVIGLTVLLLLRSRRLRARNSETLGFEQSPEAEPTVEDERV
jgi:hypothetical protein